MKAGETADFADADDRDEYFYGVPLSDEIFARIDGISFHENSFITRDDLSYVRVLYVGFDSETYVGELIVNKKIEDKVISIFKELYEAGYQIEKMRLVDEYGADDEKSMADNNTSAFSYRTIAGTDTLSDHALGLAIDINPLYNPYITYTDGIKNVSPSNSSRYVDRSLNFPHKIDRNDTAYQIFTKYGFLWGGDFEDSDDYQHFYINLD